MSQLRVAFNAVDYNKTTPNQTGNASIENISKDGIIPIITIDVISSLLSCVLNFLIILTFVKTPSLRTPSNILILGLAITDFGVGVGVQPIGCVRLFANLKNDTDLFNNLEKTATAIYMAFANASFLTITAITIDRFLALHLHLRYQELVTTKRTCIVVIIIMISSLIVSLFTVFFQEFVIIVIYIALLSAIFLLDIFLMVRITRAVDKHSEQIRQARVPNIDLPRFKKTVNTMYYIMGTFLLCYTPYGCNAIILQATDGERPSLELALYSTGTLLLINSSLNPVIYFWRIQEMRKAVSKVFKDFCCQSQEVSS